MFWTRVKMLWRRQSSRWRSNVFPPSDVGRMFVACESSGLDERSETVVSIPGAPPNLVIRHFVESCPGEGTLDYYRYEFSSDDTTYIARAYSLAPEEAHFFGKTRGGQGEMLTADDMRTREVREAAVWLRESGRKRVEWLTPRGGKRLRRLPGGRLFWL